MIWRKRGKRRPERTDERRQTCSRARARSFRHRLSVAVHPNYSHRRIAAMMEVQARIGIRIPPRCRANRARSLRTTSIKTSKRSNCNSSNSRCSTKPSNKARIMQPFRSMKSYTRRQGWRAWAAITIALSHPTNTACCSRAYLSRQITGGTSPRWTVWIKTMVTWGRQTMKV